MSAQIIPDALADALGRVVADYERQLEKFLALQEAEARAFRADQEARRRDFEDRVAAQVETRVSEALNASKSDLVAWLEVRDARLEARLAQIKDGEQGPPGRDGVSIDEEHVCEFLDDVRSAAEAVLAEVEKRVETLEIRVAEKLASVRNGEPGKNGEPGPPGDIPMSPDIVSRQIARAMEFLDNRGPPVSDASYVINNIIPGLSEPRRKRIKMSRDESGNAIADIIEH